MAESTDIDRIALEPPAHLIFSEYKGRMRNGASTPLLITALDEHDNPYNLVLKLRNPGPNTGNHFEGTSLACELICSVLARAAGLKVPDYFVVDVPLASLMMMGSLVPQPDAGRLMVNTGTNFACAYAEGYLDWGATPQMLSEGFIDNMESVMAFDGTTVNDDRRTEKPNLMIKGEDVLLIDHSFTFSPAFSLIFGGPFLNPAQVANHPCRRYLQDKARQYICLISKLSVALEPSNLLALRSWIPTNWEMTTGHLDKIFEFLTKRPSQMQEVAERLRTI